MELCDTRGGYTRGVTQQTAHSRPQVFEETGFDCSPYSSPDDQPLTYILQDQQVTLYVCPGVPESTVFQTQTRKEISVRMLELSASHALTHCPQAIEWFKLTDLPTWRKKGGGKKGAKFYGVTPFVQSVAMAVSAHSAS